VFTVSLLGQLWPTNRRIRIINCGIDSRGQGIHQPNLAVSNQSSSDILLQIAKATDNSTQRSTDSTRSFFFFFFFFFFCLPFDLLLTIGLIARFIQVNFINNKDIIHWGYVIKELLSSLKAILSEEGKEINEKNQSANDWDCKYNKCLFNSYSSRVLLPKAT
jgi:hypothetical protein